VTTAAIADNAVTSAKIANGAVTADDLAAGAVTAAKLNQMAATSGQVLTWNGTTWSPVSPTTSLAVTLGEILVTVPLIAAGDFSQLSSSGLPSGCNTNNTIFQTTAFGGILVTKRTGTTSTLIAINTSKNNMVNQLVDFPVQYVCFK
jgi:hypothetical protein